MLPAHIGPVPVRYAHCASVVTLCGAMLPGQTRLVEEQGPVISSMSVVGDEIDMQAAQGVRPGHIVASLLLFQLFRYHVHVVRAVAMHIV